MAADNEKFQGYAQLTNPQLEEIISDLGLVKSGGQSRAPRCSRRRGSVRASD